MFGRWIHGVSIILVVLFVPGCTRIVVKKDPGVHDKGFRFNRPKPYLYIGPISQSSDGGTSPAAPAPSTTKPATGGGGAGDASTDPTKGTPNQVVTDNNFMKIGIQLKYLPDYSEEYSLKLRPGLGIGSLSFQLQDGWNLTSVNMQTNQEVPEMINSVANLLGAVGGLAGGGGGGAAKKATGAADAAFNANDPMMSIIVDSRPDVPLGFYEAIIATDPQGHKSLFGWRYIGFAPFTGCPVVPCVQPNVVTCSPNELWGLVATPNSIKFDHLSSIERGYVPGMVPENWPYKYHKVPKPDGPGATDMKDAPPFSTLTPATPPANPQAPVVPSNKTSMSISPPTQTASPGEQVSFTASVSAGGSPVAQGSVTLQEKNSKQIYAPKSVDPQGHAVFSFQIPSNAPVGSTFEFTADFVDSANRYLRTSAESSITIAPPKPSR